MLKEADDHWDVADASDLYEVQRWGKGYFSVSSAGHLLVHPTKNPNNAIDLKELVDRLQLRGMQLPILVRFNGILQDRLRELHQAFQASIQAYEYQGKYRCIYPIKVNQQRQVVEEIIQQGRKYGFGVEAGSKPELLALIAMTDADVPIICNGFKDGHFIEMALLAQKIGRQVVVVVEKYTELELILRLAERIGVRPHIGMRIKLASRGSGRWQSSGGHRSKFGLTVSEILRALDHLAAHEMADCFKLLHFHLGSQVTSIRHIKDAIIEAARIYTDLKQRGAGLEMLDVGGGLGVDYDGSQTNFHSSVNYTLEEYANDVVYHIKSVCDSAGVAHPCIVSESGRSIAAYHSVLVFSVLGVSGLGDERSNEPLPSEAPRPLHDLQDALHDLTLRNVQETYHDAQLALETAMNLFATGHLSLDQRSIAENLFWATCRKLQQLTEQLEHVPEELEGLARMLADTYFCNFSLFQSMPDSWAIKQLFPLMPIHRLDQRPTRPAVLGDITCDSDGKVSQFIDRRDVKPTVMLHPFDGSPYYLAAFLVGAYQEILGDLHNLFGDTNAVHVDLGPSGEVELKTVIKGDTVKQVLEYVQIGGGHLMNQLQASVEQAVQQKRLDHAEAGRVLKFYEERLHGYTYLDQPVPVAATGQPHFHAAPSRRKVTDNEESQA